MGAKIWEPDQKIWEMIHGTFVEIRGRQAGELYDKVTFKVHNELFGMAGITFHKDHVAIARKVTVVYPHQHTEVYKYQASIIFHELVHVAQQEDLGWFNFMATYVWEWIRCGLNYGNMKKMGFEKQAIDLTKEFADSINYRLRVYKDDKISQHYGWEDDQPSEEK